MRFILTILYLTICQYSFAQFGWVDGYIVTNTRDTIHGKIYYSPPGHRSAKITFRENGQKEKIKFRPFTIKGYYANEQYFVSKIYDINPSLHFGLGVFMRLVNPNKKGHVKIYEYWNTDGIHGYNQTFLVRREGTLYEIDPLKFKKTTAKFFKDYPQLQKDIQKGIYKKKDLQKIVDRYNSWRRFDKWNEKYNEND